MLLKRPVAPAAVVLVAVLGWGCGDSSPNLSSPSPQPTPTNAPTPLPPATVTHTLIITASPSCTELPAVAAKRTYPAQVQDKSNGDLVVLVVNSYDIMIGWANDSGFAGTRDGNTVHFDITDDIFFSAYAMVERVPGVGDLGYSGTATGTIDDHHAIVATFTGEYRLDYGSGRVLCKAPNHRIEVTPVGS